MGNATPYYVECEICKEHGWTLEQYKKLSRRERYTWYLFRILHNEKEQFAYEEMKKENETKNAGPIGDNGLASMRDYMQ